jgi:hypothetical protein
MGHLLAAEQAEVLRSFDYLFNMERPVITPQNVRISVRGSMAYVTCDEVLTPSISQVGLRPNFQEMNPNFSNEPAEVVVHAINIYVRRNGEYLLTHHSAGFRGPRVIQDE